MCFLPRSPWLFAIYTSSWHNQPRMYNASANCFDRGDSKQALCAQRLPIMQYLSEVDDFAWSGDWKKKIKKDFSKGHEEPSVYMCDSHKNMSGWVKKYQSLGPECEQLYGHCQSVLLYWALS